MAQSACNTTITAATYTVISSEFNAANISAWLTTSYLVTCTAFQPLYGRFSDILGRRICFFVSIGTFSLGCLGCGCATNIVFLNCMRALAGFGGGGLMTMATIVNSDMIPFRKRGMYQALQNGVFGFGALSGASLGGSVADYIGWRWSFLLQLPVSSLALALGIFFLKNPAGGFHILPKFWALWAKIDISGAMLLVCGISLQLVGLSLGGNELPWDHLWVIGPLTGSVLLLALFMVLEAKTPAIPIIPLRMLNRRELVLTQIANNFAGLAAYAYLFMLPLYFQVVLLDSATTAGFRLAIPSLATPTGGLVAGIIMSRWGKLLWIVRAGALCMVLGNALVSSLAFHDASWKYLVYVFPANFGQGMINPGILFTSLASFDHADHAVSASTTYLIRSLGAVWGVTITSTILQNTLSARLPEVLNGVDDKDRIIDAIRHSVTALRTLPPDVQLSARLVYYDGIRFSFITSTAFAGVALVLACFVSGDRLRRAHR